MAKYRLRAAKRKPDGVLDAPLLDNLIDANTLAEAIAKAKDLPAILADPFITGFVWLTDENGNTVWELEA
jgi:hypothetical protein